MVPYYDDGQIQIFHGDCREVLESLDLSPALVLTDPPFNVGFNYGTGFDDNRPTDEYGIWLRSALDAACRGLIEGGWCFCWMAMPTCEHWSKWFPEGWRIFAALKDFVQYRPTEVQYSWDPVVFWQQGKRQPEPRTGKKDWHLGKTSKWVSQRSVGHPCPRPIDTARFIVELVTRPNELVLDPFMGSGTALRAAKDLGRRAIGIELEERYCEVAANRLAQSVLALGA